MGAVEARGRGEGLGEGLGLEEDCECQSVSTGVAGGEHVEDGEQPLLGRGRPLRERRHDVAKTQTHTQTPTSTLNSNLNPQH